MTGGDQLPAGGGAGLYGAGKLRGIAALFHQGNGKGAGAHHVGRGGAGDGTERGAGDDSHFGRAAGGASCQAQGDVLNEVAHAASLQQGAEKDEQRHVCSGSAQRTSEDALGDHEHVVGHAGQPPGLGLEHARHEITKIGVDQENDGNQGQRGADQAPGSLQNQHSQNDEYKLIGGIGNAEAKQNGLIVDKRVQAAAEGGGGKQIVIPCHALFAMLAERGIDQKQNHHGAQQVQRPLLHGRQLAERRRVDQKQGNEQGKYVDHAGDPFGQLALVILRGVFPQDFVCPLCAEGFCAGGTGSAALGFRRFL